MRGYLVGLCEGFKQNKECNYQVIMLLSERNIQGDLVGFCGGFLKDYRVDTFQQV